MLRTIFLSLLCGITMLYAVDCNNTSTTIEMKECAYQDFHAIDKELNKIYKKLMKTLDKEGKQKLKSAQKAWLAYRDAEAEFAADTARGGTMAGLLYTGSQTDSTKRRVQELKNSLEELNNF